MDKRNEKLLKQAKKRAVRNTIIEAIIISFIAVLMIHGMIYFLNRWANIIFDDALLIAILFIIMLIVYSLLMWQFNATDVYVLEDKLKREEKDKKAETILSSDPYVEVLPKEVSLRYSKFFKEEIPKIGKYYATLSNDDEDVKIVLKLDKYDEDLCLENISKSVFIDTYEVLEKNK